MKDVKIVLIEDNSDDAELSMRSLKKNNLANDIEWLKDGAEALDHLDQYKNSKDGDKPRLILLDLKLPKISGIEVLESIKSDSDLMTIPVVIMTSSREDKDLERCYTLGVNSYIVKPIKFSDFTEVIKDVGLYWLMVNVARV